MSVVFYCTANPPRNVNVALSRPSYISSEHESGDYPASNGNDGDKWTCYPPGSNAKSSDTSEQNPWYGVDLGMAMNVDSVKLTTLACCFGIVNEHHTCLYNVKQ